MSNYQIPHFKPDVPAPMLERATEHERYVYEQLSISRQQNEWIIGRLSDGERRFDALESAQAETDKVAKELARYKETLTSKWAVVAVLCSTILLPVAMMIAGAMIQKWAERIKLP